MKRYDKSKSSYLTMVQESVWDISLSPSPFLKTLNLDMEYEVMEKKRIREVYLARDVIDWIIQSPYPNEETTKSYSSMLRHLLGIPEPVKEVMHEEARSANRLYNVQGLEVGETRILPRLGRGPDGRYGDQTPIHNAITRHMRKTGQVLQRTELQHGIRITRTK